MFGGVNSTLVLGFHFEWCGICVTNSRLCFTHIPVFDHSSRNFIIGPFDRKWVFGVISGNLHVYAPNYTLVFNTSLAKNAY